MTPALDHAAELPDSSIWGMNLLDLAFFVHRFGPCHGIPEPSFDIRHPDENQAQQMRRIAQEICARAREP